MSVVERIADFRPIRSQTSPTTICPNTIPTSNAANGKQMGQGFALPREDSSDVPLETRVLQTLV